MEVNGCSQGSPFDTANWVFSPTRIQGFSLIPENILGTDILQGQTLQTSTGAPLGQGTPTGAGGIPKW